MPPFPRRITVHAVCSASQDLLEAVEREPKAAAQAAVIAASAGVRQALRMPSAALANALARLVSALLSDVPYRLTQQALRALLDACERLCTTVDQQAELLDACAPLWTGAIVHANRDVRAFSLTLLAKLSSANVELPLSAIDRVLDCGVTTPLAQLLCESDKGKTSIGDQPSLPVLCAVLCLRGLLRSAHAATRCRDEGLLAAQLRGMPAAVRQGAVGLATAELLMRLGELGAPCALGIRLRAALLGAPNSAPRGVARADAREAAAPSAADEAESWLEPWVAPDAYMVWPEGWSLGLHQVRARVWEA